MCFEPHMAVDQISALGIRQTYSFRGHHISIQNVG